MDNETCARIELVTAIHVLASHFENALYAFGDDVEARKKAEGDIAHAMKVAERHNRNGPGCTAMQQAEKTNLLQAMGDDEKAAALRFCETCDDGEGYDVPRQMMKRLETLGLVIDKKFGRFEQTTLLLGIRDDLEAWAIRRELWGR